MSQRRNKRTMSVRIAMPFLVALLLMLRPTPTYAHPLGNFTVNRYSRLEVGASAVRIRYIIDMAEIPTFQEMPRIDTSGDGQVDTAERDAYLSSEIDTLRTNLRLSIDDAPVALQAADEQLEFPTGQGGLQTLRLSAWFTAALPQGTQRWQGTYHDTNFSGRIGWQEIVVQSAGSMAVVESTAPSTDQSHELRSYPTDMLQSPLAVSSAEFAFAPSSSAASTVAAKTAPVTVDGRARDSFAELMMVPVSGPLAIAGTILGAFLLGAGHALAPGHGKTVVAAYLVGSRGTARHAVFLGLTTTLTHTAGVFALGLVTLFISQFILPEQLYPWLGVVSGLLVVVIGYTLARARFIKMRGSAPVLALDHDHSGGDDYAYTHTHADGTTHSHVPPGADGAPITWRNLLALGVSGGLLPCPSALVVLLSAIALQRVGFGMVLIVAFSLGLASVLTAIGIMLVYAGRWFARLPVGGFIPRVLPVASAVIVTLIGLGITWQALIQTGLLGS